MPGGSWPLKLINAGPQIHAGSNWLEAWHIAHVGYSASHVKVQVVLRSFKLKAVEMAEKKSKEAAAKEFSVDPKRIREYPTFILL